MLNLQIANKAKEKVRSETKSERRKIWEKEKGIH